MSREVVQYCINFDMPADAGIVFIGKAYRLVANAAN